MHSPAQAIHLSGSGWCRRGRLTAVLAPLEGAIVAAAALLALIALGLALARRGRPRWYPTALRILEAALLAQAAIAVAGLAQGHRPDELITFAAYGITSLVLVPVLLTLLSSPDEEYGGPVWPHVLVAIACTAVAVVVWRMGATWPGTGG